MQELTFERMRLYLFPELPFQFDGYGLAVLKDFQRFDYAEGDYLVFFTDKIEDFPLDLKIELAQKKVKLILVQRNRSWSHILKELVCLRHPSHFYGKSYQRALQLPDVTWDYIFCGDVIFYYHLKDFVKYKSMLVRFHNLWSKLVWRAQWKNVDTGWRFMFFNLWLGKRLEKRISLDANCQKAFITKSDLAFYETITGDSTAVLLPVIDARAYGRASIKVELLERGMLHIVWFGTVVAHNTYGVKWFINDVFKPLRKRGWDVAFHLYGRHTEQFDEPNAAIYAYGRFDGDGLPRGGRGLFINPDLLGGGVKLKMQFMLENGLNILSTPFGMDGYEDISAIDSLSIKKPEDWLGHLISLFSLTTNAPED